MRINKLTDYSIILVCEMSQTEVISSKKLSEKTNIPYATVNKLVRLLVNSKICLSKGGKQGGFYLSKSLDDISLLDVILAIEGGYDRLTDCLSTEHNSCSFSQHCRINKKLRSVDHQIFTILQNQKLSSL